jgi:hypothetical protein
MTMDTTVPDYYRLLGVARSASTDEINRAFQRQSRVFHPDAAGGGNEEVYKMISLAYENLKDPIRRRSYDLNGAVTQDEEPVSRTDPRPEPQPEPGPEPSAPRRPRTTYTAYGQERQDGHVGPVNGYRPPRTPDGQRPWFMVTELPPQQVMPRGKRFNLGGVGPAVAGAMVVLVAEAARLHFNLSSISSTNRALLVVLAITAAIATQRSWRREGASRLVIVGLAVAALFLPITIAALASVLIAVRFATIKKVAHV